MAAILLLTQRKLRNLSLWPTREFRCLIALGGTPKVKKRLHVSFLLLLSLAIPKLVCPQESKTSPLLEVILVTYDASRTETLVYLRLFPNGSAEAHPMREVDFRTLALKKAQISPSDLTGLNEFLSSSKVQHLDPKYERAWGNKDFGQEWQITIVHNDSKKSIVLENFQPFLARTQKKPYSAELEKLGCLIWELRSKVTGEPLERNYVTGCQELGY